MRAGKRKYLDDAIPSPKPKKRKMTDIMAEVRAAKRNSRESKDKRKEQTENATEKRHQQYGNLNGHDRLRSIVRKCNVVANPPI